MFKAIGKLFKRKKNKNKDKGSGIIIWIPDLDPLPPQPYAFTGYDLPVFGYNTATRC